MLPNLPIYCRYKCSQLLTVSHKTLHNYLKMLPTNYSYTRREIFHRNIKLFLCIHTAIFNWRIYILIKQTHYLNIYSKYFGDCLSQIKGFLSLCTYNLEGIFLYTAHALLETAFKQVIGTRIANQRKLIWSRKQN